MVDLHQHQIEALTKIKNGCILNGDVGSGKSITAAAYYMKEEAPRDVYVITTAKKRDSHDWLTEFAKFGVGRSPDESRAGTLTIDSWNNIGRYRDVQEAFFIFDEQRVVGSGAWSGHFERIARRNHWILLSATPGDTWLDYIPVFVANGFYKNRTEFKREHVVYSSWTKFPKVERYLNEGKLLKIKSHILVEMPMMRHTTRHCKDVWCDYDVELMERVMKKRWNVYEEQPLKDVAELFRVMRRVANSNSSRMEALKSLMVSHPRVIVFYNFGYELEQLRSLKSNCESRSTNTSTDGFTTSPLKWSMKNLTSEMKQDLKKIGKGQTPPGPNRGIVSTESLLLASTQKRWSSSGSVSAATDSSPLSRSRKRETTSTTSTPTSGSTFQIAEWNGSKHEPIPTSDRWLYLVQYRAGAEGWNCIETDAMVFFSQTYSYKDHAQAHGRTDRLNTPYSDLYYYHLVSKSFVDQVIRMSLDGKKSFNERRYTNMILDID